MRPFARAVLVLLAVAPAFAAAAFAGAPATLEQALARAAWDPARQGVLLAVDPKNVGPEESGEVGGSGLAGIAAGYGRRVLSAGSLTVLAPATMVTLNARPGPPNFLAGMSRSDGLLRLLTALRPEQWRLLGGPRGLGAADLDVRQRPFWDAIVPDPMGVSGLGARSGEERVVSPEERAGVRLRLSWQAEMVLAGTGDPNARWQYGRYNAALAVRPQDPGFLLPAGPDELADARKTPLGATVPARPKPGHLDFDALPDAPIALAGAATVGDLIARAARATRLEIHADRRVGALPVWTRGSAARARDVLRALALAVTGTYRRVGSAFVLTDDLAGIGARYAALLEWTRESEAITALGRQELEPRLAAIGEGMGEAIGFAPGDPMDLGPDLLRRIAEARAVGHNPSIDHFPFPVTDLPPPAQRFIGDLASRGGPENETLRGDRVWLNVDLRLSLLLPGGDEVLDPRELDTALTAALLPGARRTPAPSAPHAPEPPPRPVALVLGKDRTGALFVAPRNADEAAEAVKIARGRGFTEIWLEAPDAAGPETLAAAIREAGGALPVVAVARLLKGDAGDEEARDRNLLGEASEALARRWGASARMREGGYTLGAVEHLLDPPGDWLRFDTPELAAARLARVADLAATPGLAGLALADTVAPGYNEPERQDWYYGLGNGGDFGYTLPQRLAFLRREGYDPIDLSSSGAWQIHWKDVALPFFPDEGVPPRPYAPSGEPLPERRETPALRWRSFRHAANVRFLDETYRRLRAERPDLPLLMADRSGEALWGVRCWASWDRAEALPACPIDTGARPRRLLANVFLPADAGFPSGAADLQSRLESFAADAEAHDGLVLDLSELPLDAARRLLEAALLPASN